MSSLIRQVLHGEALDLGGFRVRRVLPHPECRLVGPFIFFDHIGPADFAPGEGLDVRPHPHIALAAMTYLFEGEILHRDSLGNALAIKPGAVNWMTAGRGIVHSERTPAERRSRGGRLQGIQAWVALPSAMEDVEPGFAHHKAETLPLLDEGGLRLRLIAGAFRGLRSPVVTASPLFCAEVRLQAGASVEVAADYAERSLYLVDGEVSVGGQRLEPGNMAVLADRPAVITAAAGSLLMLLGGEPLDGQRHIWWNFVASSRERIDAAKRDWAAGRFPSVPGDERDFIPLPNE